MKIKIAMLLAVSAFVLGGCSQDDLPLPPEAPRIVLPPVVKDAAPQKKETARHEYRGERFRDPFVPLNSDIVTANLSDDVPVPNISNLSLKGIFDDDKQKVALINGGQVNYLLKGNRLYDNRNRLVKGFSGVIRTESVLIIGADKTTKELRLREK
ncbi:MAG: hypothetical protein ACYC5N_08870 [Endomicrobiales bacterium]